MRKFLTFFTVAFPVIWLCFIAFQYFSSYPTRISDTWNFQNYEYIFLGLAINWGIYKFKLPKGNPNVLNGIKIFASIILNMLALFLIGGLKEGFIHLNEIPSAGFNMLWRSLYMIVPAIVVSLSAYAVGDLLLQKFFKGRKSLRYFLYSSATGVIFLVFSMFALGVVNQLRQIPVAILLALPILFNLKKIGALLKLITTKDITVGFELDSKFTWLYSISIVIFAFILSNLLKPFPTGWDSSAVYVNISNLLALNSHLISGFEAYNWSIFTSIGLIVFKNLPTTFLLSFMGGIWAFLMLFDITKRFVTEKFALTAAFIFSTLPSIYFLSFVDSKVDLGFLFFGLTCVSLMLDFFTYKNKFKYIILTALLAGFAIGIKYTAVFLIIALGSMIFYQGFGIAGGLLVLAAGLIPLFSFSIFDLRAFEVSNSLKNVIVAASSFTVLFSLIYISAKRFSFSRFTKVIKYSFAFLIVAFLTFSPWLIFNYSTTKTIDFNGLFYGKFNSPGINTLIINNEIASSQSEANTNEQPVISNGYTGLKEDLGRYIGYEQDSLKFFTLPYDMNVATNIKGPIVDIGFLILGLLPVTSLVLLYKKTQRASILIGGSMLLIAYAAISFAAAHQMLINLKFDQWTDAALAITGVIVVNLLLTLPAFLYYTDKKLKVLCIFLFVSLNVWTLLGSGIYWYSITTFALLIALIFINIGELSKEHAFFNEGKILQDILGYFIGVWIAISAIAVFYLQASPDLVKLPFFKYIQNNLDVSETVDILNPAYAEGVQPINNDSDARVYRVGSFLYYLIDNNYQRVFQDNQLDVFNEINVTRENKELVATALKKQGYEYIIYDLNTASIDRTSEKTLTKKAEKFEAFLKDNTKLELITTDKYYLDENRKPIRQVFGDQKKLVRFGTVAVYRIID